MVAVMPPAIQQVVVRKQNDNIRKLGTTGALSVGDAFDCDVNNDGVYDSATERFYYIGNLSTNSSRAVLIYYNNTNSNGDASANQTATYNTGNNIKSGPTVAKTICLELLNGQK